MTRDGRAAAWNLVAGVNDPPVNSERTVWLDGEPSEAGPATFSDDLAAVDGLAVPRRGGPRAQREPLSSSGAATGSRSAPSPASSRAGWSSPRATASWKLTTRGGERARSAASSSFECIAPIRSRSGSAPDAMISTARSTSTLPASRSQQHANLLLDQRLQRLAVAQRVVDGEADRLLVAAGPEPRDRLDDRHVVGVVAASVRASGRRAPRGGRARCCGTS